MTGFLFPHGAACPMGPASRKRCSIEQGMGETVIVCSAKGCLYIQTDFLKIILEKWLEYLKKRTAYDMIIKLGYDAGEVCAGGVFLFDLRL